MKPIQLFLHIYFYQKNGGYDDQVEKQARVENKKIKINERTRRKIYKFGCKK